MDIRSIFRKAIESSPDDKIILANGKVLGDKRDVDDPTAKFFGPVHIGELFKTRMVRPNIYYAKSEYDLPMLANAVAMDGILRRATNIFTEFILKNGYEITSNNDKLQKHIILRIKEIQNLTGLPFFELLNQIATQLVTYGNAYVIKVRQNARSKYGKWYRVNGKEYWPIVGLFPMDATTVAVGLTREGDISTYRQKIRGEIREWDERDVIHFAYDRIPGTLTGRSALLPVIDDVRALRKLEEEIEILGFQYSIPLYLYKVGNKDVPPAPGEVEEVSSVIQNMPAYGMLVVPGHHDITVPSNANQTIDIIKYVDHFKKRIYGGLGISPIFMGDSGTSNRSTSEVLDANMQTNVKNYQNIIKYKIELELIRELLLDGGFKDNEDEIEFKFQEIDIENQIKRENQCVSLWQNNLITRTEARNQMDYEVTIKEKDTFLELVKKPEIAALQAGQLKIAQLNADSSKELAKLSTTKKEGSSGGSPTALPKPGVGEHSITKVIHKVTGPSKNTNTTSNKVAPANQHGKKARPKYVKDSEDNILDGLSIFNKTEFVNNLKDSVFKQFDEELDYTINKLCSFYHMEKPEYDKNIKDALYSGIALILENRIDRASKMLDDEVKLNLFGTQIKQYLDEQFNKLDNLAKILLCKALGSKTILITSANCEKHTDMNIDPTFIDYSKIPPFGYQCNCEISEENFNDN